MIQIASAVGVALSLAVALSAAQARERLLRFVNRSVPAVVTSVADGDTVRVRLESGGDITVRLDGIDTPESDEPFGPQARNATRVLLFDKRVQVHGTDVDRYDRLVARVMVDGRDSSLELVKAGLACHFTRYSSDAALAAALQDAKAARRGFWAADAPKPACANGGRPAPPADTSKGRFRGNSSSRRGSAGTHRMQ